VHVYYVFCYWGLSAGADADLCVVCGVRFSGSVGSSIVLCTWKIFLSLKARCSFLGLVLLRLVFVFHFEKREKRLPQMLCGSVLGGVLWVHFG